MLLFVFQVLNYLALGISAQYSSTNNDNEIFPEKIRQDPTYFILASRTVRPGQSYSLSVSILKSSVPITVRASITRDGVELATVSRECRPQIVETLTLKVPPTCVNGVYKLQVEGDMHGILGGTAFYNETLLHFSQRSMTIFIQTDKPIYIQGDSVQFRTIPVTTDLKAFPDAIDIYMVDPRGTIMHRWLSRQTNFGAVSLQYQLSLQPLYGNWTIRVIAQGQVEEKTFYVEEYYQTPYEVNVTLPSFIMENEQFIQGSITANFTSGAPVTGNATIRAFVESLQPQYKSYGRPPETKYFIHHFEGHTEFKFAMADLRKIISHLDSSMITIIVDVGEHYLNRIETGFAQSVIFKASVKLEFLGASPQVFKPAMPFKTYVAVSYYDSSPLVSWRLNDQKLELNTLVHFKNGVKKRLETRFEQMSPIQFGIWEITVDLASQLESLAKVNDVYSVLLEAKYADDVTDRAKASLLAYASYTPTNNHIHVSTSTRQPKVGEYIIFHVRSDYYVDKFSYLVVSKGIVLLSGTEVMTASIKTFAVTLTADMAPTAMVIVYNIAREGEVVADSLTFPVDGMSRNNFSININSRKDKSGDTVEVIVEGHPGTFVGLSAVDRTLYSMRTGNDLNYNEVLEKMNTFEESMNGTHSFAWHSRGATSNQFVHFPSDSYAMDASQIFQYCGLIVFTDASVPRLKDGCNHSIGYTACMDGTCYPKAKHCDGYADCSDGSDEIGCVKKDIINRAEFQRTRINRIKHLYQSSWLWRDISIGPLGYSIFNVPIPDASSTWVIGAFSMNAAHGFGLLSAPIQFSSTRPFYIVVEMPKKCHLGEEVSIKISVFNYYHVEMEVLVSLADSPDYKFVPVDGAIPYTQHISHSEHQHIVFVKSGTASVVYMPINATRTGHMNVTVMAKCLLAKDLITKPLYVEAEGIPQYKHTSILLDLTRGSYLIKYLDTNLTESPVVPYKFQRLFTYASSKATVSVSGDVFGAVFPFMPLNASSLLRKPSWCGEQNMFDFAANLYSVLYMRLSGQRQPDVEKQAFHYLNIGYQRQLSYQNEDGSFVPFRWNTPPSVWLTAFCIRIFSVANFREWENSLYIDPSVISGATEWILQYQTPEGAFFDTVSYPYDRKMNLTSDRTSDLIKHRNISLTAHVLIALSEIKDMKGELGAKVELSSKMAQQYLEKMLHVIKSFKDPHDIAIVAYALTITNSIEAEEAFNLLDSKMRESSGLRYWSRGPVPSSTVKIESNRPHILPRLHHRYEAFDIETTAYALLVHVKRQAVIQKEIVGWLNTQRSTDGGWASTQDTIICMQALMEYSLQSRVRDVTDVSVTFESPSSHIAKHIQIDDRNSINLQKMEIPNAWGPVIVKAQGSGLALVQLSVDYNVDWRHLITPPPVSAFNLDVKAYFFGRNNSHISIKSCQGWHLLSESKYSGMAVLEIGTPTGYIVLQHELHSYVRARYARNLREARFEEGKTTFYFEYLDSSPICVTFTMQRWFPVANLTRYLPAKVYEYYAPERYNETMMDMYTLNVLNVCQVCGSYQCPYCPVFSMAQKLSISTPVLVLSCILLLLLFVR